MGGRMRVRRRLNLCSSFSVTRKPAPHARCRSPRLALLLLLHVPRHVVGDDRLMSTSIGIPTLRLRAVHRRADVELGDRRFFWQAPCVTLPSVSAAIPAAAAAFWQAAQISDNVYDLAAIWTTRLCPDRRAHLGR